MNIDASTRLIDLTVGELMAIVAKQFATEKDEIVVRIESRLNKELRKAEGPLYGLDGMCEALHCSKSKVMRLKKRGDLEGGYQQIGGTIIVNDPQALRDIAVHNEKRSKRKLERVHQPIL